MSPMAVWVPVEVTMDLAVPLTTVVPCERESGVSWSSLRDGAGTHREEHVDHVLLDRSIILDRIRRLAHALTLSSKERLVDRKAGRGDGKDARVGWDLVSHQIGRAHV